MMDSRILRRLHALYHPKVHHIGNKSECRIVIAQGVAVGGCQDRVLFQSGEGVLYLYSDPPLFGVMEFLSMSKFFVFLGSFVRNDGLQLGEVLPDSLIP